jgi:hypothetical protein
MKDHHEDKLSLLQQGKSVIIITRYGCNSEVVLLISPLQASKASKQASKLAPGKIKRGENKSQQKNCLIISFKLQVN